jgi:hypothetical protein
VFIGMLIGAQHLSARGPEGRLLRRGGKFLKADSGSSCIIGSGIVSPAAAVAVRLLASHCPSVCMEA